MLRQHKRSRKERELSKPLLGDGMDHLDRRIVEVRGLTGSEKVLKGRAGECRGVDALGMGRVESGHEADLVLYGLLADKTALDGMETPLVPQQGMVALQHDSAGVLAFPAPCRFHQQIEVEPVHLTRIPKVTLHLLDKAVPDHQPVALIEPGEAKVPQAAHPGEEPPVLPLHFKIDQMPQLQDRVARAVETVVAPQLMLAQHRGDHVLIPGTLQTQYKSPHTLLPAVAIVHQSMSF